MFDFNREDLRRIERELLAEHNYGIANVSDYENLNANTSIAVRNTQTSLLRIEYNGKLKQIMEKVECTFELHTEPHLYYLVCFVSQYPIIRNPVLLESDDGNTYSVWLVSTFADSKWRVFGIVFDSAIHRISNKFDSIRFHFSKFPLISNQNIAYYNPDDIVMRTHAASRLTIEFSDYRLEVDALESSLFYNGNSQTTNTFTHYAVISRKDADVIEQSALTNIRTTVYLFISLLAGRWCPLLLTDVYDAGTPAGIIIPPEESSIVKPGFQWALKLTENRELSFDFSEIIISIHNHIIQNHKTKVIPILLRWYFECMAYNVVFETCIMSCVAVLETIFKLKASNNDIDQYIREAKKAKHTDHYEYVYPIFDEMNVEHRIPHFWADVKEFNSDFNNLSEESRQSVIPLIRKIRNKLYHHEVTQLDKVYSLPSYTRVRIMILAQQLAEETLLRYLGYTGTCAKRDGLQTNLYG
jgi:hypothetical protein